MLPISTLLPDPVPGASFPVLTASNRRLNGRAISRALFAAGQFILAVNLGLGQALPALQSLMPKTLWIGPVVSCIGGIAASVQYLMDKNHIKEANNTPVTKPEPEVKP